MSFYMILVKKQFKSIGEEKKSEKFKQLHSIVLLIKYLMSITLKIYFGREQ